MPFATAVSAGSGHPSVPEVSCAAVGLAVDDFLQLLFLPWIPFNGLNLYCYWLPYTAFEFYSAAGVSNVPDVPALVGFTAAVGVPAVVGFPAVDDFPAFAGVSAC
jgi:hypothetical protein